MAPVPIIACMNTCCCSIVVKLLYSVLQELEKGHNWQYTYCIKIRNKHMKTGMSKFVLKR